MIEGTRTDAARVLDCLPSVRRALGTEVEVGPGNETISSGQFYALRTLAIHDRTAGELASLIMVALPSLTQLVDGLVERGWVARYADPSDRRKVWLSLTEPGRLVYARARQSAEARIAEMLARITDEERDALVQGLEAFKTAIHEYRQLPRARAEAKTASSSR
ncbi:MAG: hypothetical protein QOF51_1413 [Chloroflexota bacterium]|jgi:DNA-binding MarR family transcriptional regulator|nr:hypothetical protein [Chloroflexota bacterium]